MNGRTKDPSKFDRYMISLDPMKKFYDFRHRCPRHFPNYLPKIRKQYFELICLYQSLNNKNPLLNLIKGVNLKSFIRRIIYFLFFIFLTII
jgi:hypothetical protein